MCDAAKADLMKKFWAEKEKRRVMFDASVAYVKNSEARKAKIEKITAFIETLPGKLEEQARQGKINYYIDLGDLVWDDDMRKAVTAYVKTCETKKYRFSEPQFSTKGGFVICLLSK